MSTGRHETTFSVVWSAIPIEFGAHVLSYLNRNDQIRFLMTNRGIFLDLKNDSMWELVGRSRFQLTDSSHGQWRKDCDRIYFALSESIKLCQYIKNQNAFSLGYINRDIKERIQSQILSMVLLTSNILDTKSREVLMNLDALRCLLRLANSSVMGICDTACTAIANCLAQSGTNQSIENSFTSSMEHYRGTRVLRDLLLSPAVAESGPGPTKQASRTLVNFLIPEANIICSNIDVWEGYIVEKQNDEMLDSALRMKVNGTWIIEYRHCSGTIYMEASIHINKPDNSHNVTGSGSSSKDEQFTLSGQIADRNGVHNLLFDTKFSNNGLPYGPLPILHRAFWSSMHPKVVWGVWEVGTSPHQHSLGTGGVFYMLSPE
ncbi:hypothetical protein THRCLA_10842 [Thraustotheca clavata]|uniref:F-box domain-containing protein n=1 Tax=Thraustotheca clavata TaxID=74557 RepID=A0A1V9YEZ0_9STRA|nr:hypothetical protein THRCLA_10842 [Thraustotheca clavata]